MAGVRKLTVACGLMLCGVLGTAGPAAATGSISGKVTDASTHEAIADIGVCVEGPFVGPFGACGWTDAGGNYAISGLQPGSFIVGFAEGTQANFLEQYYNGKATRSEADGVIVADGLAATGIDAALEKGGQITGKVTDFETHAPIEGVKVCAFEADGGDGEGVIHCDRTDVAGEYTINGLQTDQYEVEFFVEGSPNYITQYYPGKASRSEAVPVSVTAGAPPVPNIDAAMQEGIQVSGVVTEVGGPGPTWSARVCALTSTTEVVKQCGFPEFDGTYSIAGLPFGFYVISFSVDVEEDGQIMNPDGYVRQYYNGKPTFAEADRIGGPGPGVYTGIDARLVKGPEVFPRKPPAFSQPVGITPVAWPNPQPLKRCRKGYHRKKVRGKSRCVRSHKHRKHHH
jgi:hypothetical protein